MGLASRHPRKSVVAVRKTLLDTSKVSDNLKAHVSQKLF